MTTLNNEVMKMVKYRQKGICKNWQTSHFWMGVSWDIIFKTLFKMFRICKKKIDSPKSSISRNLVGQNCIFQFFFVSQSLIILDLSTIHIKMLVIIHNNPRLLIEMFNF